MCDLTYLRKLMGNAWVDAEVYAANPSHLLGQYYNNEKARIWLRHTEELVKELLTNPKVKFDTEVLADKIEDPFISTLAEMESAVFLARQGFEILLEPNAPKKGPDIRAAWEGVSYFVEVRAAGLSEDEERRERVTKQIFAKMNETPSAYSASFVIGDEYHTGSHRTKAAIELVIEILGILKEREIKKATLYYDPPNGKVLLPEGTYSMDVQVNEIIDKADLVVRFQHLEKQMTGTTASLMKKMKTPPEPVNDHERLKAILNEKRKQLPKPSRGIIALEVTEQFMLSDFSVESALYGDLQVHFQTVHGVHEPVGELIAQRNNRGFFRQTSRVSAIVVQRRLLQGDYVTLERKVYPTNRANNDTIRLTLAELQHFGDPENREHLAAEHAPDHVDEDVDAE